MRALFRNIGPGTLVAAAFIGPGTVTVCTLAGVEQGFTLLWAMLLSVVSTVVLQEMAARLGLVTGHGLASAVRTRTLNPGLRHAVIALILLSVLVGNAAYEAGNIGGGVLGLEYLVEPFWGASGLPVNYLAIPLGILAFFLLYSGSYRVIERVLVVLVVFMSLSFIISAILTRPNLPALMSGLFVPSIPEKGWLNIVGLVGTTVVPYNLFLHASAVREKWKGPEYLKAARRDTYLSVALGGLVSMAIIVTGAALRGGEVRSGADLAAALNPLYGDFSSLMLSLGLFAAGITSAITAPMAAAYVAQECFGWDRNLRTWRFRLVWLLVLSMGVVVAALNLNLVEVIRFAQVANGLLLPFMAGFLLWAVNGTGLPARFRNKPLQNLAGGLIVVLAFALGVRSIYMVLGV